MSKWCEHCVWQEVGEHKQFWFQPEGPVPGMYPVCKIWNYCPACGTPRPKEKTLAEKFLAVGWNREFGPEYPPSQFCEWLAEIAEAHYASH